MYKNVAQKLYVYAYDVINDVGKTGDAGNITCRISKDGTPPSAALGDTNPTEVDATNMKGWYVFDILAAESNADEIVFSNSSATANIILDDVSVFTKVEQSGDSFARLGTPAGASVSADIATIEVVTDRVGDMLVLDGAVYKYTQNALEEAPAVTSLLGSGTITFTYTLTSTVDSSPISDADVWVTSDAAGTDNLASGKTNQSGEVVFQLDAGTVYVWRQKSGMNFDPNPDTETVA